MAENPPLTTSINTSPPTNHSNTLSPQNLDNHPSSIPQNPQNTPLSSHQSPKKPTDSNESLNLCVVGHVSSGFGVGGSDGSEISGVLRDEIDVGFETNGEIDKIDELGCSRCGFDGSPLVDSVERLNLGEVSSVFDDNVDDGGGNCGVLRDEIDVGFETNGENGGVATYSLTMELIDETVVLGGTKGGKMVISHGAEKVNNGVLEGKMVISHDDVGNAEDGGAKGKMVISHGSGDMEDVGVRGKVVISHDGVESVGDGGTKGKMVISHGVENGKVKYSRKEMEKLRYVDMKSKKKFWQKVYNGFSDEVRKEYDDLGSFRKNKQVSGKKNKKKKKNDFCQANLGDSSSENVVHDTKNSTHSTYDGEDVVEWSEEENSDDEYYSIQRPAFMVEGEPDFESGPPEDGFEYLRRVRWEASHIPKVKVVKLDNHKLKEQSAYMPKIPGIEKCPQQFAPSRQWEDEFIADFSELRLALSILVDTNDATSEDADTIIFSRPVSTKHVSKNLASVELPAGGPTLSTLQTMEPVTRVALLNKCISMFETASNFSKDDCAWLFALCAVVETPLDADTSASMRCLLRRCAKLRAEKEEFDDEVAMLNILATISGRIFGQSEN
ncbi:hypothetical protein vseg_012116 [Gypsophila vaccaria]